MSTSIQQHEDALESMLCAAPVVAVGDAASAAAGRHPAITNATARTFEMRLTATSSARLTSFLYRAGGRSCARAWKAGPLGQ